MYTLCIYVYTYNVYACARMYNARIQQIDQADQVCVAADLCTNICMPVFIAAADVLNETGTEGHVCVCGWLWVYTYVHIYTRIYI